MCFALTIQSITIFIKCGSRNETEETSGAAHFLEHLHFKGTGKRSRVSLESDVENIGAHLNAYTSRENTSYTMNFLRVNCVSQTRTKQKMLLKFLAIYLQILFTQARQSKMKEIQYIENLLKPEKLNLKRQSKYHTEELTLITRWLYLFWD